VPAHPWLSHLDPAAPHAWLDAKGTAALAPAKGESLVGSTDGRTILHRVAIGRGQIIYVGWELANSMPHGRLPSTVEQEKNFEEQVRVLLRMSATIFPTPPADR